MLAPEASYLEGLGDGGTELYVTARQGQHANELLMVPKDGAPATLFAASPEVAGATETVANASTVYWNDMYGALRSKPKLGGPAVDVATEQSGGALTLDGTHLYWLAGPALRRVALTGGSPEDLAVVGAWDVAIWQGDAFLAAGTEILRVTPGSAPVVLVSGQSGAAHIAADASGVYWTEPDAGRVKKASLDGTNVVTLADGQPAPGALALDDARVYWIDRGSEAMGEEGAAIVSALKQGSPVEALYCRGMQESYDLGMPPARLVVDGSALYATWGIGVVAIDK